MPLNKVDNTAGGISAYDMVYDAQFKYHVRQDSTGRIVATTYDRDVARAIADLLNTYPELVENFAKAVDLARDNIATVAAIYRRQPKPFDSDEDVAWFDYWQQTTPQALARLEDAIAAAQLVGQSLAVLEPDASGGNDE